MSRLWIQTIFHHMSTAISDLTLPDSVSQLQTGLQEGKSIYHRNEQLTDQHTTNLPPSAYPSSLRALPFQHYPTELVSVCLHCLTPRLEHEVQKQGLLRHQHTDSITETWSQLRFISLDYREISGQY